jgi:hypothetical protein
MEILLGILIGILFTLIIVLILKKREKENPLDAFENDKQNLKIVDHYLDKEQAYFYEYVSSHLSSEFMFLPKVGVDNIVQGINNDLKQYNAVKSKYVDFLVVDRKTQKPLLAVDLVEVKASSDNPRLDRDVTKALEMVKVPLIVKYVEQYYIWDILRQDFDKYLVKEDVKEENKIERKM